MGVSTAAHQDNLGDILKSFAGGAAQGPTKSLKGVSEGAKAVWTIIKALPNAKARAEMAAAFQNMTPHDRQAVIDGLSEAAGAGLGAYAGGASGAAGGAFAFGLGAIPGAAAGGMAGAGLGGAAGRFVSRLVSHWTNPEGVKGDTASDEARGMGEALTGNAFLEGAGRLPGAVVKATRGVLAPTGDAARVAGNARNLGVPQSLGVATGNKLIQKTEAALAKHPFSSAIIMGAKQKAQDAFESALQKFTGGYSPSEVGPEAFQDAVEKAMGEARKTFQSELQGKVNQTAGQFGPAKTAVQAGEELQAAHLNNTDLLNTWKNKAYPELYARANHAGVSVDPTRLGETADKLLAEAPEDVRNLIMSGGSKKVLQDASAVRPDVSVDTPSGIQTQKTNANPLLLQEAQDLRSALYRRASQAKDLNEKRIIAGLADAIDGSIENSVKGSDPKIYNDWRALNQQFKSGVQAVRKPSSVNPNGNPMAGKIKSATEPEKLVDAVTDNRTRIQNADLATNPDTITRATDPAMNTVPPRPAMDAIRRNVFDRLVQQNIFANGGRISPSDLHGEFVNPRNADRLEALFGGRADDLVNDMGNAAGRENALYDSKLGRVLDQSAPPSSQQVMDAAFPRRNADASATTLSLLPDKGIGQRAFVEDLAAKGTRTSAPNRATGQVGKPLIEPFAMTKKVTDAGETVPAVLGSDGAGKLGDILEVGRANYAPEMVYGNPSGTAHMGELFRIGRDVVTFPFAPKRGAAAVGKLAAGLGTAQGVAKLVTSPTVVSWATTPASGVGQAVSKGSTVLRTLGAAAPPAPGNKPTDDSFIEDENFIDDEPPQQKQGIPAARKLKSAAANDDSFIEDDTPPKPGVPAARKVGQ